MPNRIIKESICYSEDIDMLTAFEETVFFRLIINCDDYGRIDARSNFLKSKLFVTKQGITEKNIQDAVAKLASVGLVRLYEVDGKSFLLFPKWHLHQRVRNSKEKYPGPEREDDLLDARGELRQVAVNCGYNPIQSESNPNPNPNSIVPFGTPPDSSQSSEDGTKKEPSIHQQVYDHYMTLGLVKHRKLSREMCNAIDTAQRRGDYTLEEMKTMLDRHDMIVKASAKDGEFAVRPRPITEFFGQKVRDGTALICSEYADDGAKWRRYLEGEYGKNNVPPQNDFSQYDSLF